jgi:protein phosphatase
VKSGKISEEESRIHPQRSVITRAVGTDPDVDVDAFTIEAEDGDVFLICSDGLSDMVEDVDILELVDANRGDLEKAVRALVQFANKEGGEDNITAVAFRISAGSAEPAIEDTVTMPALSDPGEPDEKTPETVDVAPRPEQTGISRRRLWIVLGVLVVVAIAVALLIWGLSR